jgi:hypothetical protein
MELEQGDVGFDPLHICVPSRDITNLSIYVYASLSTWLQILDAPAENASLWSSSCKSSQVLRYLPKPSHMESCAL